MSKSNTPYTPQPNSLPSLVVGFFQKNPDEYLTLEDIADKFQVTRNNIHTNLSLAVQHGLIARSQNDDGDYIYKAGTARTKAQALRNGVDIDAVHNPAACAPASAASQPKSSGGKRSGGKRSPLALPDFSKLVVEAGVPIVTMAKKGQSKWQPLFAKLDKPGLSLVIDGSLYGAVGVAARKLPKGSGTFKVAMVSANSARVWRVA